MADAYKTMKMTGIEDVSAKITFSTANVISSVTCTLKDSADAVAGGINGTAGFALNQLGTSASDTVWRVWYDDFSPTDLNLSKGFYTMTLRGVDSSGDAWPATVGIHII